MVFDQILENFLQGSRLHYLNWLLLLFLFLFVLFLQFLGLCNGFLLFVRTDFTHLFFNGVNIILAITFPLLHTVHEIVIVDNSHVKLTQICRGSGP